MAINSELGRNNRRIALAAFTVVAFMVGVSFAFVPLYTLICQVTGLGGTPQVTEHASQIVSNADIDIRFDANVDRSLPWTFEPKKPKITLKLGETGVVSYLATNTSDEPVTGISTFNVTPLKVAQYFTKIECFCFIEQTLEPGQTANMPVTFYVDPALSKDDLAQEVKTVTLSYTFYRSLEDIEEKEREGENENISSGDNQIFAPFSAATLSEY